MKRREALSIIPLSLMAANSMTQNVFAMKSGESLFSAYNNKIRGMLHWIRKTQAENILEAAHIVARTKLRGGTCWRTWDMGHSTTYDSFAGRQAEPEIFVEGFNEDNAKKDDCFLAASRWGGNREVITKKDIKLIGMPVPWGGDAIGHELVTERVQKLKNKPVASVWIETQLTTHGALLKLPGIEAPFGPASGILGTSLYWMIMSDACRIMAQSGKSVPVKGDEPKLSGDSVPWVDLDAPLMDDYFDTLLKQMEMIEAEYGYIKEAAKMAVDTVLAGGKVWVYSTHGPSLPAEGQGRRGGLFLTHGLRDINGTLTAYSNQDTFGSSKDLVIIGCWEPDNPIDLKHLDTIKKKGMKTVSIGPVTRDIKVPSGRTVPKETDIHIGRMSDTYGLFAIPGFDRKVCPTSGALILQSYWSTCMEIADEIIRRTGNSPCVYLSGALASGRNHNSILMSRFLERGY